MAKIAQRPTLSAPEPLSADHDLSQFNCGDASLNHWLQHRASKNESRFSRTYVVCHGKRVVAFYCLLAGAVERTKAPGKMRRNAPDAVPVSVPGRLAVDVDYAGRGLGADLLADALRRVALASQSIGIGAVLVHAKSEEAKRFYLRCAEFLEYPADSRILFLPIETVLTLLAE
jgi:GNAT superfamily N-acetyltransferase